MSNAEEDYREALKKLRELQAHHNPDRVLEPGKTPAPLDLGLVSQIRAAEAKLEEARKELDKERGL